MPTRTHAKKQLVGFAGDIFNLDDWDPLSIMALVDAVWLEILTFLDIQIMLITSFDYTCWARICRCRRCSSRSGSCFRFRFRFPRSCRIGLASAAVSWSS